MTSYVINVDEVYENGRLLSHSLGSPNSNLFVLT